MLLAMRRASSRDRAMAKVKAVAREALSWFIAPDCRKLGGLARRAAPIKTGDILCKEVVEHGAHNSDDGKFCDVFPSGRDRSAHYVGGKRKFERKQNPSSKFEPDLAAFDFVSLSNGERSVARNHVEVTFKCGVQAPSVVLSHLNTV